MNIVYTVIENGQGHPAFHRFEGAETSDIIDGEKLPGELQRTLYGPATWTAQKTFGDEFTRILEGLRLLIGEDKVSELTRDIFEAGVRAGVKPKTTPQ